MRSPFPPTLTADRLRIGTPPAQAHWDGLLRGLVVMAILTSTVLASYGVAALHL